MFDLLETKQFRLFIEKSVNLGAEKILEKQIKNIIPFLEKNGYFIDEKIDDEEYHKGLGFSSTNFKSDPGISLDMEKFKYRFVNGGKDEYCFKFGRMIHSVVLENKSLESYKEYFENDDFELAQNMISAINKNQIMIKALKETKKEISIYWVENGLILKAKIDAYFPYSGAIVDLKTTSSIKTKFNYKIVDYEYMISASLYAKAVQRAYNKSGLPVAFVFVSKSLPSRCDTIKVSQNNPVFSLYTEILNHRLKRVNECIEKEEFNPNKDMVEEFKLESWHLKKIKKEIS